MHSFRPFPKSEENFSTRAASLTWVRYDIKIGYTYNICGYFFIGALVQTSGPSADWKYLSGLFIDNTYLYESTSAHLLSIKLFHIGRVMYPSGLESQSLTYAAAITGGAETYRGEVGAGTGY